MLTRRGYVGHVGPALAVEDLGLRHQLAVRLTSNDHDLVAHHGGRGRRGTSVVELRQLLPCAVPQSKDAIGLSRRQLLAGHEAADHDGLALVGHGHHVVQRQRQPGARRPVVAGRVVHLRGGAGRLESDPPEDPELAVHSRSGRVLAPEGGLATGCQARSAGSLVATTGAASPEPEPPSSPPPPARSTAATTATTARPAIASSTRGFRRGPARWGRRAGSSPGGSGGTTGCGDAGGGGGGVGGGGVAPACAGSAMKRSCSLDRRRPRRLGGGRHLTAIELELRALLRGRAIDSGREVGCPGKALPRVLGGCARHDVVELLDEIGDAPGWARAAGR